MAWIFRKRIKIIPGIHLNIGARGISTTIGVRGANINIGSKGTYLNTGISGSGISYIQKLSGGKQINTSLPYLKPNYLEPIFLPSLLQKDNIFSLDPNVITSQDMQGIKDTIINAHQQLKELQQDKIMILEQWKRFERRLSWSYWLLYGFIFKEKTEALKQDIITQKNTLEAIDFQLQNSKVELDFNFDDEMLTQYKKLFAAFEELCATEKIWDITSSYINDRFTTRSAANFNVRRQLVRFRTGQLHEITSKTPAMIWQNINGADLYFYPNFLAIWDNREHFAIIGYNELDLKFVITRFIEEEKVPHDSEVVDHTWFKVNKSGQPDRRFRDNYQIPITAYGDIELKTTTGLNERYLFSCRKHAEQLYKAILEYQISLLKLDYLSEIKPID